uniref:Uncharacterized protein n=1 Tax=Cacopsylla melanoneura TaxID=428564 RepID=A0A8D8RT51_9HEMI
MSFRHTPHIYSMSLSPHCVQLSSNHSNCSTARLTFHHDFCSRLFFCLPFSTTVHRVSPPSSGSILLSSTDASLATSSSPHHCRCRFHHSSRQPRQDLFSSSPD